MKPVINLDEPGEMTEHEHGSFHGKYVDIGGKIGAKRLGYNLTVVPPGKKVCPFHNHRINEEMFLVIEGEGLLRFGDQEYPVKKHDVIACPPGDRSVAHQILNTGDSELKYLALSTLDPYEIAEYPDSNKMMSMVGTHAKMELKHVSKADQSVDYFEGEH